jgi:hypothetical protein
VLKDLARWVRRSTKARANSKRSSLVEKIILPRGPDGLPRLSRIRKLPNIQRDEYSFCTSKFESDMPSHGVGLCSGMVEAPREALDAGKALDGLLQLGTTGRQWRAEASCR